MLAQIMGLKEWHDGSGFPILIIHANRPDQAEELEALKQIEEAVVDIIGHTYGNKLVSTQDGSGQRGLFTVDLSAILTMLRAVKESKSETTAANAYIRNWLKPKVKPEWLPTKKPYKIHKEYTCRCGLVFRSKKSSKKAKAKMLHHQKRCAVLKDLQKRFDRGKQSLLRRKKYQIYATQGQGSFLVEGFNHLKNALGYVKKHKNDASYGIKLPNGEWYKWDWEHNGRKKEKSTHKSKTGKAEGHKSKQASRRHKDSHSRSKTRRSSRRHSKEKKR